MSLTAIIADEIAMECAEDYVGLWSIPNRLNYYGVHEDRFVDQTLAVLREVASMLKIRFGGFVDSHFVPWDADLDSALSRIKGEWEILDRCPDIGEIAWFTAL